MTFKELLTTISDKKFIDFLRKEESLSEKGRNAYYNTYLYLKDLEPANVLAPLEILVFEHEGFYDCPEIVIEGIRYKRTMKKIPDDYQELENFVERYSFSFNKWAEVLSYPINEKSIKTMDHALLVFTILDEIMEFGITEEAVETRRIEIEAALDEAEKDIAEGRYYEWEDTRSEEEIETAHKKMAAKVEKIMKLYYEYLKE